MSKPSRSFKKAIQKVCSDGIEKIRSRQKDGLKHVENCGDVLHHAQPSEGPTAPVCQVIKDVSDFKIGAKYSITINPNDRYQFWDHEERFKKFCQWLLKVMHSVRPHAVLDLHTEISLRGRLHAHGTIEFKNPYDFYLKDWYTLEGMCNIDIDTIYNYDTWVAYATKQQDASPYKHYTLDDTSFKICPIDKTKFKITTDIRSYKRSDDDDNVVLPPVDNG